MRSLMKHTSANRMSSCGFCKLRKQTIIVVDRHYHAERDPTRAHRSIALPFMRTYTEFGTLDVDLVVWEARPPGGI